MMVCGGCIAALGLVPLVAPQQTRKWELSRPDRPVAPRWRGRDQLRLRVAGTVTLLCGLGALALGMTLVL
jgi:hypothetical protein